MIDVGELLSFLSRSSPHTLFTIERLTMSQFNHEKEKDVSQMEYVEEHRVPVGTGRGQSLVRAAAAGAEQERAMSVIESIKMYPKAIVFSMAMSLCLVQEGYDTAILGSFFAQPAFRDRFGTLAPDGSKQITPKWQSGLLNGCAVGEILGLQLAGLIAERIGYRKTLMAALIMLTGSIFISFFAKNLGMLFAGDVSCPTNRVLGLTGSDALRNTLGSIPDDNHHVRRRRLPDSPPPRLDQLCLNAWSRVSIGSKSRGVEDATQCRLLNPDVPWCPSK